MRQLLAVVVVFVAGCSNQQPLPSCDKTTIYQAGERDGRALAARAPQLLCSGDHADARSAYQSGYAAGLSQYCLPANGWRLAVSGESYRQVCSDDDKQQHLSAYKLGVAYRKFANQLTAAKLSGSNVSDLEIARLEREVNNLRGIAIYRSWWQPHDVMNQSKEQKQ